ncbi:Neutral protease 2-like [Colletotrichum gloeosporioides]|uniref:Neutral protease 2 n=1 Tax=Colletotrichum gloeosporioides TaxID=474922 RepID=A0A8H4CB22_COLGL|nr:Neutral protease 2-like [Colletotrichum gloeosporioides]KAF3800713.1 Neutral protease 2-like [Colletotrichum gloeosporioides]
MLWQKVFVLSALAIADAHPGTHGIRLNKRDSRLEVTLEPSTSGTPTEVIATIKNNGADDLNLLKVGTILDDKLPVQRVVVTDQSAGESIAVAIDVANVHYFEKSGRFSVIADGLIPVGLASSTSFDQPAIAFKSNAIDIDVDAVAASRLMVAPALAERTNVQAGCNETTSDASLKALANCQVLALAAAADAADPSSKRFVEYFGTNSSETRNIVVTRLKNVAQECSTTNSGVSRYFCYDYYGVCEIDGPLNAYTAWDVNTMVMCPLFYGLPPLPQGCHRQCQATTTIHETTHCEAVYEPHTNDYAYAYNASVALPSERALQNADNYSLYANAVYMSC